MGSRGDGMAGGLRLAGDRRGDGGQREVAGGIRGGGGEGGGGGG